MPSYPSINDREFNLLKKITENTAEISAGGGGGGGSATWGDIIGNILNQADLVSVLDSKATPADISQAFDAMKIFLNSGVTQIGVTGTDGSIRIPSVNGAANDYFLKVDGDNILIQKGGFNLMVLAGGGVVRFSGQAFEFKNVFGGGPYFYCDSESFKLIVGYFDSSRTVNDAANANIENTDTVINYVRTDAANLVFPNPANYLGRKIIVCNNTDASFNATCSTASSFFKNTGGLLATSVFSSLTIPPCGTYSFQMVNGLWRVCSIN